MSSLVIISAIILTYLVLASHPFALCSLCSAGTATIVILACLTMYRVCLCSLSSRPFGSLFGALDTSALMYIDVSQNKVGELGSSALASGIVVRSDCWALMLCVAVIVQHIPPGT